MTPRRFLSRELVLFVVAALATVLFVAMADELAEGDLDTYDRAWALAIHGIDRPWLDDVMIVITNLGDGVGLYGSVLLVSAIAWRRGLWPMSVILLVDAVLAAITNWGLKQYFVRPRPALFDEITRPETWSFPSGHAMSSMAVYGAVAAVLIGLYPAWRWRIVVAAALLITAIGLSRVYLGVHWPFDVLAGFAAGTPFVVVTTHLVHGLFNKSSAAADARQRAPRL